MLSLTDNKNENSPINKLIWWLLTGLAGIVFATIGSWAMTVDRRLDEVTNRQISTDKTIVEINTKLGILLDFRRQDEKDK